jgi:hypothetical protein
MATNKTITFTRDYTVTKHFNLKKEMNFDEFKEQYFCEDNEDIEYAEMIWNKILKEHASKKGVVCLEDGGEGDENEWDDDDGDYDDELDEPIGDLVNEVVEEIKRDTKEYQEEVKKYMEQVRQAEEGMKLAKERMKELLDAKNKDKTRDGGK